MFKKFPALELYTKPKVLAVFFLGISSGLPLALVLSTLSVWLTEEGVSRAAIGLFAVITTPYAIKFMWSPLIDQMPLPFFTKFLGRRRGWMIFTQIALAASLVGLGLTNPSQNALMTALMALFVSISSASQDIVIDAYRVEILEENQQGAGAAMIVFGYRIGMLVSGAGALFAAQYLGWFMAYAIMAALIGIGAVTVMITGEPEVITTKEVAVGKNIFDKLKAWLTRAVVNPFSDFMQHPGWITILLFIVLYKLADAFAGVMTNPFLIETGFSKAEIATIVKSFGFAATIVGSFVGGYLVNRWGMIKSLWVCGVFHAIANLSLVLQAYVGYNVELLAGVIAIENLSGGMGTTAFVAYISSLCNKRYTATQYALFSSLASVGRTWLSASSGWFVDQLGWVNFFIFSALLAIPGLVMLVILQRQNSNAKKKMAAMEKTETTDYN